MQVNLETTYDNGNGPGAMSLTLPVGDDTVRMPLPFLPVGVGLAIFPLITPTEGGGFHCDMTRWVPGKLSTQDHDTRLPIHAERTVAIHAALAFEADSSTRWTDSAADKTAWLRTWLAAFEKKLAA